MERSCCSNTPGGPANENYRPDDASGPESADSDKSDAPTRRMRWRTAAVLTILVIALVAVAHLVHQRMAGAGGMHGGSAATGEHCGR